MPKPSVAHISAQERGKIQKALEDLALLNPGLTDAQRKRLEEIEETLRLALLEK